MATVIYNCKKCKVGKRMQYNDGRERSGQYSWPFRLVEGRKVFPGPSNSGPSDACCPSCGKQMTWNYLKAVLVVDHKCDARCTHARGGACDCSCGGKNHGTGWAA